MYKHPYTHGEHTDGILPIQLQLQHNVALALKSRYVKLQLRLGWACFGFSSRFRDIRSTMDRTGGHRDGGP